MHKGVPINVDFGGMIVYLDVREVCHVVVIELESHTNLFVASLRCTLIIKLEMSS